MARILIADDHRGVRTLLTHVLSQREHETVAFDNGDDAMQRAATESFDLVISDIRMPGADWSQIIAAARQSNPAAQLVLITGYASVQTAVQALQSEAAAYLTKPFEVQDLVQVVDRALQKENEQVRRQQRMERLQQELAERFQFDHLIGVSQPMQTLYELMHKVLNISSNILIQGESGTGKELVARAIHYNGTRRASPFVAIDCGSLPDSLLESELFGHVKGAFTGATADKVGLFEAADGGTAFLDEIAHMSAPLQTRLLRVIETGEIRRVGASTTTSIDVRLIAATNRPLQELVEQSEFRQDLYFRLKVITLSLPPLRDRKEDIPLLARHFVRKYAQRLGRPVEDISGQALERLAAHDWPGNVRELEHAIERAVALTGNRNVEVDDLPDHLRGRAPRATPSGIDLPEDGLDLPQLLKEIEADLLHKALERTGGVKDRAAKLLGLNRTTLVEKLKRITTS